MSKDDHGKIVLVMIEGDNKTLQEGIRTFANAVVRAGASPRHATSVPPTVGNGHTISPQAQTVMDILEEDHDESASLPSLPSAKKSSNKRRYYSPKIVEIDFNNGDVPFEEYCKEKNPNTTIDRYLVAAMWLKEFRGIEILSTDHIYTCFKKMGWGVQRDMAQPFRSAKSSGYMDSAGHGEYKINHIGEDKVRKMGGG